MNITDHQWKMFGELSRERYERQLQIDLHSRFPRLQAREPEQLRAFVHERVSEALGHGIQLDQDILRYLEILLDHGPGITQTGSARAILANPRLSGEQKVWHLDQLALFSRPLQP